MCTDRAVTWPSSEPVSMRPIVDRQTPVKTLPSLAVGKYRYMSFLEVRTVRKNKTKCHNRTFAQLYYQNLKIKKCPTNYKRPQTL